MTFLEIAAFLMCLNLMWMCSFTYSRVTKGCENAWVYLPLSSLSFGALVVRYTFHWMLSCWVTFSLIDFQWLTIRHFHIFFLFCPLSVIYCKHSYPIRASLLRIALLRCNDMWWAAHNEGSLRSFDRPRQHETITTDTQHMGKLLCALLLPHPLSFPSPSSGTHWYAFNHWRWLCSSRMLHKRNVQHVLIFAWLFYLAKLFWDPAMLLLHSFLLFCWIESDCIHIVKLAYLPVCWRTFWLLAFGINSLLNISHSSDCRVVSRCTFLVRPFVYLLPKFACIFCSF